MTTKLAANGDTVTVTTTGNVTKNELNALGVTGGAIGYAVHNGLPAVPANTYTTGDSAVFLVEGVFSLRKKAEGSSALVVGQHVYWRTTGGYNQLTGVAAAADGVAGVAMGPAVTGATTALVKLLGLNAFTAAT